MASEASDTVPYHSLLSEVPPMDRVSTPFGFSSTADEVLHGGLTSTASTPS